MKPRSKTNFAPIHSAHSLHLWTSEISGDKIMATGVPSQALSTNPLVINGHVIATIDSPGMISCLDHKSGKQIWTKRLDTFVLKSPALYRGKLFAVSERAIYAIDPKNGNNVWVHAPYNGEGEWIYSGLCFAGSRLFYGDVTGHFQCLDIDSGRLLWRERINSNDNRMVNSTAIVEGKAVIAATNEGFLVAMEQKSGKELWRTRIDGPCCHPIHRYKNFAVAEAKSLFFFNPRNGNIHKKLRWKDQDVDKCFSSMGKLFLVLEYPVEREKPAQLLALKGLKKQKSVPINRYVTCISLSNDGKSIYLLGSGFLDIISTKTLERVASICGLSGRIASVTNGVIYSISMSGIVTATKLPPTDRSKSKNGITRFKFPKPFSPSEYLRFQVADQTAEECAKRLGWTVESFEELLNGKRKITKADSIALGEKVFGPSADLWIRIQDQWDMQTQ